MLETTGFYWIRQQRVLQCIEILLAILAVG